MNQEKIFKLYKLLVVCCGIVTFTVIVLNLESSLLDWRFFSFAVFTSLIASRMSLNLPRSSVVLSFSDSMIFLAFLLFGGKAAIFISTLEILSTLLILRHQGIKFDLITFLFNIASNVLSTTLTYLIWLASYNIVSYDFENKNTTSLITSLGILALSQFVMNSTFASVFHMLKSGGSFWDRWRNDGFTISITQIAGATLAGVAYKLITYGDIFTTVIVTIVLSVAYFNYRKIIRDMNSSIEEAEQAQKEKAESEKVRAEQAELHAEELGISLSEQERISDELQKSNDALEHAAYHDALTKLPNRAYLIERLNLLLEIGIEISHKYYVIFLDLHRFKNINDSLGHTVGDKVLMLVARRLLRTVRFEDTVARLGGDEFAIILNDLSSVEEAMEYAEKIHHKLTQPFSLRGHKIFTNVHMGISPFDSEHKKPEDILRDADIAMHHAKEKGSNFAVFDKELRSSLLEKIKLEADLRFAIQRNELSMHYQPLISLKDGEIIGFEALLRWNHAKLGFISPVKFIPIAEESDLIIPITNWILKQTTDQLAEWQKISTSYRNLMVSVNISGKHLAEEGLLEEVKKCLKNSKLAPSALKLEITESTAMSNAERTIEILNKLNKLGVQLSIDDFGTGYSSLSYLHRLPFDTLKVDRSFVYPVGENGENSEILQTIVSLAKNLKMRVIAEGIETESQLQLLQNLGCDYGQGYLFSKPLPQGEMEDLLYKRHVWFPKAFIMDEIGENSRDKHLNDEQMMIQ
jgi:diguanylate cyclase (GGDEF)-like protein